MCNLRKRGWQMPVVAALIVVLFAAAAAVGGPVKMFMTVGIYGGAPVFAGLDNSIMFIMSSDSASIASVTVALEWTFTNGNVIGPLQVGDNVTLPTITIDSAYWDTAYGLAATDPDTTLFILQKSSGVTFTTAAGPHFRLHPTDSCTVTLTPLPETQVLDSTGTPVPYEWLSPVIEILPCPVIVPGDANGDGVVTTADVIHMICFAFRSCSPTVGEGFIADVNCNGSLTSADIIFLISYLFRSGPPPCNDYCAN